MSSGKISGYQFRAEKNGGGGARQKNREGPSADTLQKLPGQPGQGGRTDACRADDSGRHFARQVRAVADEAEHQRKLRRGGDAINDRARNEERVNPEIEQHTNRDVGYALIGFL